MLLVDRNGFSSQPALGALSSGALSSDATPVLWEKNKEVTRMIT
jgi:hypothetical protein